jgi:WhiB family transcriptional regulator, redox-sensing transcriptional regulator
MTYPEPTREDRSIDWMEDAACKGTGLDMFFPISGSPAAPAQEMCDGCEVREQCLNYAVKNNIRYGVWGGLSERHLNRYRMTMQKREWRSRRATNTPPISTRRRGSGDV